MDCEHENVIRLGDSVLCIDCSEIILTIKEGITFDTKTIPIKDGFILGHNTD